MTIALCRLAAAAAVLAASTLPAAHAQTVSGSPSIASYHALGMCLDVRTSDNAVLLWNCHGGWNQAFRFVDGSYGMISLGNQQCLTSGLVNGPLTAQTCTNTTNQRWGFQNDGSLRNELGLCADIAGGSQSAGAEIYGWGCHGGTNQKWYPAVTASSANLGLYISTQLQQSGGAKAVLTSAGFSGANIVASGGGNIVASGGGNLIANDGTSIVAGGAGNLLANDGASLIANDGAGIVAGGAGNFIPSNYNFFNMNGAGVIAAGAGN
jgi:hypothetical protein